MSRHHFTYFIVLLTVFLAGCAAVGSSSVLPVPQVWVTPGSTAIATRIPPAPEATATAPPPPASSLVDLAFQAYGDRIIQHIAIPALGIYSPVVPVGWQVETASTTGAVTEWDSPGAAVGWVLTSALPDGDGNIILYGHNNMYGAVFKKLWALKTGDAILLETGVRNWEYSVAQVELLPLTGAGSRELAAYRSYLQPTDSPRLTVISCWPPESNTHRVVVIAYLQIP
jgi:LPXTG-site transpeptidase (sortase) family protein